MTHGTEYKDGACLFRVWAPLKDKMTLHILSPEEQRLDMTKQDDGYFSLCLTDAAPGLQYYYIPDDGPALPDPAAQAQPEGVFGPSAVIDHAAYEWQDKDWHGIPPQQMILYELHIGCFTEEGTFAAAITQLDDLAATGINAISLMPVNQFSGHHNWGYDGVFPYAVQNSYGGPEGLKQFVDACHTRGIAVLLDIVYNHLGPEGNVFSQYGPYFTDKYHVPWGQAINFDNSYSDGVRAFFIGNMLYWLEHYHMDGFRADAIHEIYDSSAIHFWEEAQYQVKLLEQRLGRHFFIVAESDLNDPKTVKQPDVGGYGFDAQWLDDFHHALYAMIGPDGKERYEDFGATEQLLKAYKDGFVHSGEYVRFRKRRHGRSSAGIPGNRFIVFNQNHDQVGNRMLGERLSLLVSFALQKTAAAAILMSPYIPMLFMGEEYGARQPFLYFTDHSDKALVQAVREGRKKEFEQFQSGEETPDPQAVATFNDSKLRWAERNTGEHAALLQWYRRLIQLRREYAALQCFEKDQVYTSSVAHKAFMLLRKNYTEEGAVLCLFNFSDITVSATMPKEVSWYKIADSNDPTQPETDRVTARPQAEAATQTTVQLPPESVLIYTSVKHK